MTLNHFAYQDDTAGHEHHPGRDGGAHVTAMIVSPNFEGLQLLKRHQMVYAALGNLMQNEIHAFSMKTFTPDEWANQKP
ncbi:MAG: BolA family transcriptional regulator [Candidatus Marinimicrobia bacterium]|nr:BolA family transcriptional regulator [Candidatus Neomarinimicrobiota bacterium]MBT3618147.1 BolA family transcriptional regulator [Candidatus Neomarinimicrobiota bacterium]MBT3828618.1 BolA family transcriptional regulator [Candidatus Neomarinimicrobiota bacterium]MBT3996920.1 BolA family transcriptional regulator [Candidatus Neomarinimicrobiota bacterium]MBT4280884.1 BolA family transcriptional regulator [Candidatus Neomarinimicrobiota bacterium]